MRFKTLPVAALFAVSLATAACNATTHDAQPSTQSSQASQPMSQGSMAPMAMRTGTFEGLNDKHVSGTVTIADGQVKLSGFSSDNGPDLHIYLTKGSDESAVASGKELGMVAADKDAQTFALNGADASMYDTVVIHCDKAKAVFGAAKLM